MNRDVSGQKCPSCETGRQTLLLDHREPFCPHIHHNKDGNCLMFSPLINAKQLISKIQKEEFSNEN